ncbi:unnamed protein product [Acidithrix sp. C25]|nr:unnamed protein product [Acidithrix sp. C25]
MVIIALYDNFTKVVVDRDRQRCLGMVFDMLPTSFSLSGF